MDSITFLHKQQIVGILIFHDLRKSKVGKASWQSFQPKTNSLGERKFAQSTLRENIPLVGGLSAILVAFPNNIEANS